MKKRIVIKLGGSALENTDTLKQLAVLVKGFQKRRYAVVLVHGGGPAINHELTRQGITWKFIDGQRQTTFAMMSVIENVLATDVNSKIVESLRADQVQAIGLSGSKHKILFCSQASAELQRVGKVDFVEISAIENSFLRSAQLVPVVAPIGIDSEGLTYNINADWAATQIAIALGADKLIFLTDQNGILNADQQLVAKASVQLMNEMIETGIIHGGMSTKVKAMITAVRMGIKYVRVMHASQASQLLMDVKIGTLLIQTKSAAQNQTEVTHGKAG